MDDTVEFSWPSRCNNSQEPMGMTFSNITVIAPEQSGLKMRSIIRNFHHLFILDRKFSPSFIILPSAIFNYNTILLRILI